VAEELRIAIIASGGGTNAQSVIEACESGRIAGRVVVVVSNNSKAGVLERARRHDIPAQHLSNHHCADDADLDRAFVELLRSYEVDVVALAGYMKKRGPAFLAAFPNRVLNIHPALLPGPHGGPGKYGLHVHESVLAADDDVTGVTIHLVDEEYDHGPVVARREVAVRLDDTPETLQQRVLKVEHELYPAVLAAVARGELDLDAIAAGAAPAEIDGA
jgi:phosphoribosylglycinamide formyltransferase-1